MPTSVKTGSVPFPWSLGAIRPGATFASASAPLTKNTLPVMNDGVSHDKNFNGVFITAFGGTLGLAANIGSIFVCTSAAAPDTTNWTNVVAVLAPGQSWPRNKEWANNRDISVLYIGAENATDFALVSIDQF
jgi:hypothetical protein